MDKRDLYLQVGELHVSSINQGFLATLGAGVVSQMYRAIDEAPGSVLLVEIRDDRVVGFISGGVGMGPIYKQMLRHPIGLGFSLLSSIWQPRKVMRMLELLRYGRSEGLPSGLPEAELLSMAVSPEYRGQHVAEALYGRLVDHFRASGIQGFKITVGEALVPAHRFYRRMGAKPTTSVEVHSGESSRIYVHYVS